MKYQLTAIVISLFLAAVSPDAWAQTLQPSTDRRGFGDEAATLPSFRATPGNCIRLCRDRGNCRAWTLVKTPGASPNCYLSVEPRAPTTNGCCDSGIVR